MINAHNFCHSVCSKTSQLGVKLMFRPYHDGYSYRWADGHRRVIPTRFDLVHTTDKVAALACASDDLAHALGWEYSE